MSFVTDMRQVSDAEMGVYRRLLDSAVWKVADGRDYQTADVTPHVPGTKRAFFIKLPPEGVMHPHVDAGDCRTDHIVMTTNPNAFNWWNDNVNGFDSLHMEQGWRYAVDRTIEHWATNGGDTDRVHLLVEY